MKRKSPDYPGKTPTSAKRLAALKRARIEREEIAMAPYYYDPSFKYNPPIPSGAPSGLYNMTTSGSEYKFVDTTLGFGGGPGLTYTVVQPVSGVQFFLLNGLATGTSSYQRVGSKINMKSLYWCVNFGMCAVDADPATDIATLNTPVRFMIVYDKQANGAQFAITDLLNTTAGVGNGARGIDTCSPNNLNNRDRFIVLADKRFVLQSEGTSARTIKKYKKLNTQVCYTNGAGVGGISEITSGSLYAVVFRDAEMNNQLDPALTVTMNGLIRLRFQDP